MKRRYIVFGGFLAYFLVFATQQTVADPDIFHQIALFRETLTLRQIPTVDRFSYVPTVQPSVHHEWGAGALFYLVMVWTSLGEIGLVLLKYALVLAIIVGCYAYARREGASVPVIVLLGLVAVPLATALFTNMRARVFTMLFVIILLLFLQEDRRGRRWWIVAWSPLYILWVNLHGGFVVGIVLVVIETLERFSRSLLAGTSAAAAFRRVWHLLPVVAGMLALILATPYGFAYVPCLWHAITLNRSPFIAEWSPIWHDAAYAQELIFALSIVLGAYGVISRRSQGVIGLPLLIFLGWQTLWHARYLSLYALVWICVTPAYLDNTRIGEAIRQTWNNRARFLSAFWWALMIFGMVFAIKHRLWHIRVPGSLAGESQLAYPVGPVDYLGEHGWKGNVMVPFVNGAYVSWRLHPDVKVGIDSRFEAAYSVEWKRETGRLYSGKGNWRETLGKYGTDGVIVPRGSALDHLLDGASDHSNGNRDPVWKRVYLDDGYSLFMKADAAAGLPYTDKTGRTIVGSFP